MLKSVLFNFEKSMSKIFFKLIFKRIEYKFTLYKHLFLLLEFMSETLHVHNTTIKYCKPYCTSMVVWIKL